jgi:protein-disulfide isomerase
MKAENAMSMMRVCLILSLLLLLTDCARSNSPATTGGEPVCNRGSADAPIRLEIYSDYECPSCRAFYLQTVKRIFVEYADSGKVCVIYRDFPTYEHSREAARYARAALRVGAEQWGRVVEAFYQTQPEWSQTGEVRGVVEAALSPDDFTALQKHLEGPTLDNVVDEDAIEGLRREVKGTPTSFLSADGMIEKIDGALTFEGMQRRLDARGQR